MFASTKEGPLNLFLKPADGSGMAERLTTSEYDHYGGDWAPDGKALVYEEVHPDSQGDIWLLSLEGEQKAQPLIRTAFDEGAATLSPDGRWMAYTSGESGPREIYVRPFPDLEAGKWTVSTEGETDSGWSPDGRELFYRAGPAMMSVAVETEPTFSAGIPQTLFEGTYFAAVGPQWAVGPDGRFLMIKYGESTSDSTATPQINVVLNWFEELRERVPVP